MNLSLICFDANVSNLNVIYLKNAIIKSIVMTCLNKNNIVNYNIGVGNQKNNLN